MLPLGFRFSQGSLQDYEDCPRRFQLRYVESRAWPAVEVEPLRDYEDHVERGIRFHRLVERHQAGLNADLLESLIQDDLLLAWWRAYRGFEWLHGMEGRRYPEMLLSAGLGGRRLVAKYDLVVVQPGQRIVVFDWKTTQRALSRQWFDARLQTRVYLYVLARAGSCLFGGGLQPEQLSLVYWISSESGSPLVFEYSKERFLSDEDYLLGLVDGVGVRDGGVEWPLTSDVELCRFCVYRSLCDRGVVAGDFLEFSSNIDNIAGVELLGFGFGGVEEFGF